MARVLFRAGQQLSPCAAAAYTVLQGWAGFWQGASPDGKAQGELIFHFGKKKFVGAAGHQCPIHQGASWMVFLLPGTKPELLTVASDCSTWPSPAHPAPR